MDKEMFKVTEKTAKYRTEIQQMMFVSGETGDPSPETTTMIEELVQKQVIEMLMRATELANRAGSRSIQVEHLIFNIREDKAKVSRLKNFLSWKDVRKTARDNEDKSSGGGGGGVDEFGAGGPDDMGAAAGGTGAQNPADAAAKMNKHKKAKVRLPWDVASFYNVALPEREDDEGDEEEEEMNSATLQRLKNADERTRDMTREEYVHWSECRQASFTFRKGKRFREWAGFGVVTDSKPNDDIVDILGFLTFEIVQTLTEEALRVKAAEDARAKQDGRDGAGSSNGDGNGGGGGAASGEAGAGKKRKREMGLFDPPEEERSPVQPKHIQEAFRRLQQPSMRQNGFQGLMGRAAMAQIRRPLKLV